MRIWVDADSSPVPVRIILCRAANRTEIPAVFVANRRFKLPGGSSISMVETSTEEGSADNHIIDHSKADDLVVTRDIPLAAILVKKGVRVINDRGTIFTEENIDQLLSERNTNKEFRESGVLVENRKKAYGTKEKSAFAAALDSTLNKMLHSRQ